MSQDPVVIGPLNRAFIFCKQFVETGWESTPARAALVEFLAPRADEVERRVLMHFLSIAADGHQIVNFLRTSGFDLRERAGDIVTPTLVVASDADTTVPLARSRIVAASIPGARMEVVEGATHIGASFSDPRVLELVSEFIAEGSSAP